MTPFLKKNAYLITTLLISIIVGYFVYSKQLTSGIPNFYFGSIYSTNGLLSNFSLYSEINLGESRNQNTWVMIVSSIYLFFKNLEISGLIIRGISTTIILFLAFYFTKKLSKKINTNKSSLEVLMIASGLFFSTYSIIFFESYTIFVYVLWFIPIKLYAAIKGQEGSKGYSILSFTITVFTAMVNLPFGILLEIIAYIGILTVNKISKKGFLYLLLQSVISITLAILPSLMYTIINYENTLNVLTSETFYRENTTILSFFRGITDWGFWGSFRDIPYRDYKGVYEGIFGYLTYLWIIIPITIGLFFKKKNIYVLAILLFFSALIIGDAIPFTGKIYNAFFSLPFSSIFRNNVKFYYLIYGIIFCLILFNKGKTLYVSFIFFLTSIPTFYLFLTGGNYTSSKIGEPDLSEYINISQKLNISKEDTVLLFPVQYTPVYSYNGDIKTIFGYSRPELVLPSRIIEKRCIGCSNQLFDKEIDILLDPANTKWIEYLQKYGITKVLYDDNVKHDYYENTISRSSFDSMMAKFNFTKNKSDKGNLIIYNTGIVPKPNIVVCDPGWIKIESKNISKVCSKGQITFTKTPNMFYWLNFLVIIQLFCIMLYIIAIYLFLGKKYSFQ